MRPITRDLYDVLVAGATPGHPSNGQPMSKESVDEGKARGLLERVECEWPDCPGHTLCASHSHFRTTALGRLAISVYESVGPRP